MSQKVIPLAWSDGVLRLVDQRYLPHTINYIDAKTLEDAHMTIKDMVVRGAPLIGFTALYGMALWLKNQKVVTSDAISKARTYLESARPTAVNLAYEAARAQSLIESCLSEGISLEDIYGRLVKFANEEMIKLGNDNLSMAKTAAKHLEKLYGSRPLRLMTLCNTGFLACGPMGTALGVISHLNELKRVEKVFAFETRPYLQGSRLTAFELCQENVPHQIVVEGAMSHLMRTQNIDAIFIGADRIVANGDTANKVGSSSLAIVASHYKVPFFVVAPVSSFDTSLETGDQIEVEMRDPKEILCIKDQRIAPNESDALNPSFDITSAQHISGIICENGLIAPVSKSNLISVVNL
tara:strand:+ start:4909 stop:5964 length:1056 start_codon:yes stop_codon:yes gene_type:complete